MLIKLWRMRCIVYAVFSTIVFVLAVLYFAIAVEYCKTAYDDNFNERYYQTGSDLNLLVSISLAILTVALTIMSLIMVHRLQNRFHGLYTDYGFKLRVILGVQVSSLFVGTIFYVLQSYNYAWWLDFWNANNVRLIINNVISNIFIYIVPMLT